MSNNIQAILSFGEGTMPDITLNDAIKLINELGAIALSDKDGKFKYVNRNYEKFMNMNLDELKKMYLWDPVPTSKSRIVMQTHAAIIGEPVKVNGCDSFCSYYPIFENGEFDGILICVVFSTIDVAANFAKKVYSLENELKSIIIRS